jgi:hypothetical protein
MSCVPVFVSVTGQASNPIESNDKANLFNSMFGTEYGNSQLLAASHVLGALSS